MIIKIESRDYGMALQTDADKRLRNIYFGQKLQNADEYALVAKQLRHDLPDILCDKPGESITNHAYTPCGTWSISEPAIHALHADGNASLELHYVAHSSENLTDNIVQTVVEVVDPNYKTKVQLFYKVYQQENVFEQWTVIENVEETTILLKKFASANLYFRNQDFYLTQFYGT